MGNENKNKLPEPLKRKVKRWWVVLESNGQGSWLRVTRTYQKPEPVQSYGMCYMSPFDKQTEFRVWGPFTNKDNAMAAHAIADFFLVDRVESKKRVDVTGMRELNQKMAARGKLS